jgi:hypothetical protein
MGEKTLWLPETIKYLGILYCSIEAANFVVVYITQWTRFTQLDTLVTRTMTTILSTLIITILNSVESYYVKLGLLEISVKWKFF